LFDDGIRRSGPQWFDDFLIDPIDISIVAAEEEIFSIRRKRRESGLNGNQFFRRQPRSIAVPEPDLDIPILFIADQWTVRGKQEKGLIGGKEG